MRVRIRQRQKSDLETVDEQRVRLALLRERCKAFGMISEGVPFHEELAGRAGMNFLLLPESHHTSQDVQRAAEALKRSRDAVLLEVFWQPVSAGGLLNSVEFYVDLGEKAARARNEHDEARAQFHAEHFRKARSLEQNDNRQVADRHYREAYAAARHA